MEDLIRALPSLLRAAGESAEVAEAVAFVAWRRAAGEQLRGQAVPFRLHGKHLVVAVADTAWKKQLEAVSPQLVFRINSALGHALVTFIEFRVDPATVRDERARLRLTEVDAEKLERRALQQARPLGRAASAIKDDDLRRRFLLAAGSYIDAQERRK